MTHYHTTLDLVAEPSPVDLEFDVFAAASVEGDVFDYVLRVVGASHYVAVPDAGYYEALVCLDDPAVGSVATYDLPELAPDERTVHVGDDRTARVSVRPEPLGYFEAVRDDHEFDVVHEFDTDAYTAIDVGIRGYTTFHTYEEFDLTVVSTTAIE